MSDAGTSGGCACGAVRYRLASTPYDNGWCHCRLCQLTSGSPALAFATVQRADYVVVAGADAITDFKSTSFGSRSFCSGCGCMLSMQVDHQPDTIDFNIVTLDEPDGVAPGYHIFDEARVSWFDAGRGLPRHARFRPDTVGIEGGDPAS